MAFFQSKHLWVKDLADGVAVLVLDRANSPVNFLDPAMLDDLDRAADALIDARHFRLLVIRSAKAGNFCHGPSPALLASWKAEDFRAWAARGQRLCGKIAQMSAASACVISGSCFDAGLELALACDHRVVVNQDTTILGFPELEWGMIPCWGGTQRLPHLIGMDNSLRILLGGQRLDAHEARDCGLADDLSEEVGEEPPAFLAEPHKRDWTAFPRRTWRQRWLESNRLGRWFLLRGAERILSTRIPQELPAPAEMLRALRVAYQQAELGPGEEHERQAIERIVGHPALHHLLRLLQHREQLRAPALARSEKAQVRRIGIVGTGLTALALLLHSATKGYEVVLRAEDELALGTALTQVVQILQTEVQHGDMTSQQFQRILASIRGTFTWTHFGTLEMVVDTINGTLDAKRSFYQDLVTQIPDSAVLVPISPLYRVDDLRQGLTSRQPMVGMRVIEPWTRGSVAEIVAPGDVTPIHAQRVREWAIAIGKCILKAPDVVGGLLMRVWLPALNEAGLLIRSGVGIERIDLAMRRFGMSYGPCEWMDRLGLDHIAELTAAMRPVFAGRIQLETGFALMVEKRLLGNRAGAGFYRPGLRKRKANIDAQVLWQSQSQGETVASVPVLADPEINAWIQERLVTLMSLEALRCLEEGLGADADDLDCAMCLTGWATHRGGPIGHARQLGAETLAARCAHLAQQGGPRYALPDALLQWMREAQG